MALGEAEVPAERLHLDAADISARALARARRGVYGKNSFRGKDLAFRDRYFQHTREGFLLDPAICKRVNFFEGNLLSDDFLRGKEEYNFVFCRNLFIYFDPAMRKKALNTIHRLMSPSGVLFVGPAELPLVIEHGFVSAGIPMAFACRKAASGHGRRDARVAAYKPARFLNLPPSRPIYKISPAPAPASRPAAVVARPGRSISTDLGMAQRLADVGHLEEAAEICEAHLRLAGPSAQAYYLLGLTRDAQKDSASADFYRKALYLEPNHYETLLQMALLSQKNGDSERAFAFQSRAQKLKPTI
jgi:chemotaxis protein methyltransferase WspC